MSQRSQRYFEDHEYERRRGLVRESMGREGLDALLIANPENVNYLSGLDHMGYFAPQLLLFPQAGQPVLITRAMEKAVVRDQVPDLVHIGYSDGNEPPKQTQSGEATTWPLPDEARPVRDGDRRRPPRAPSAAVDSTVSAILDQGLNGKHVALDQYSSFLPYGVAEGIMAGTPDVKWHNLGAVVDDVRLVQSEPELALTRQAARMSDSMMLSAIAAAGTGINAREVMAAIYDALFRRGGTYPGFVPLVRSNPTLGHEHGTWENRELESGELLFLEMSGCARRYHAPMGRLVFLDRAPAEAERINNVCRQAMQAAADTIKAGVAAGDVYENWQAVLNNNGLEHYRRHHCGYSVGIGYPPSWSGGGVPVGLRRNSDLRLRAGMVFHLMSWLLQSGQGDAFLSDTIVVTEQGCEFLTTVDRGLHVR